MAFVHGKSATFKLDNSSGTLVDYSTYLNDVSLSRSIETAETTTFNVSGSAKTYIVGLTDATFSISGLFDSAADATLAGVLGFATALDFEYGPAGSTAGRYFSGILTSHSTFGFRINSKKNLNRGSPFLRRMCSFSSLVFAFVNSSIISEYRSSELIEYLN